MEMKVKTNFGIRAFTPWLFALSIRPPPAFAGQRDPDPQEAGQDPGAARKLPLMKNSSRKGPFIAYLVLAPLVALMMFFSASTKLTLNPGAVSIIQDVVGVPVRFFPLLAAAEIAGGLGLLAGLFWPRIGVLAGAGLVLYFVGALLGHARVSDWAGLKAPILPLVLSVTVLLLRRATTRRLGAASDRHAGTAVPG